VKCLAVSFLVGIFLAGRVGAAPRRQFGPLDRVSQIDVGVHQRAASSDVSTIRDPTENATVAIFVDQRSADWRTPWHVIAVAAIEAKCFDGQAFKGLVGVGQDSVECQRDGVLVSKPASDADIHEFLKMINVSGDTI